jgi:hypothetical protein
MFIYATDPEHGLAFDDTIGFRDENGEAYDALAIGPYTYRHPRCRLRKQRKFSIPARLIFAASPGHHTLI